MRSQLTFQMFPESIWIESAKKLHFTQKTKWNKYYSLGQHDHPVHSLPISHDYDPLCRQLQCHLEIASTSITWHKKAKLFFSTVVKPLHLETILEIQCVYLKTTGQHKKHLSSFATIGNVKNILDSHKSFFFFLTSPCYLRWLPYLNIPI